MEIIDQQAIYMPSIQLVGLFSPRLLAIKSPNSSFVTISFRETFKKPIFYELRLYATFDCRFNYAYLDYDALKMLKR